MSFGERLINVRKEHGYTRESLAQELGISKFTLRNYELESTEPGHTFLKQISDFFNVSVDYLMELSEEKEIMTSYNLKSSEYEHIKKYRSLDSHGKDIVDTILNKEVERVITLEKTNNAEILDFQANTSTQRTRTLHYYQRLASAGTGQFVFDDVPVDLIEIPDIPEYKKVKYAIGVNGRSMEPLYYDGDILLVEPCKEIGIGEIGIFKVDGDSFVKKLGKNILISVNGEYSDIPITEETHCLGLVVDKISNTPAEIKKGTLRNA